MIPKTKLNIGSPASLVWPPPTCSCAAQTMDCRSITADLLEAPRVTTLQECFKLKQGFKRGYNSINTGDKSLVVCLYNRFTFYGPGGERGQNLYDLILTASHPLYPRDGLKYLHLLSHRSFLQLLSHNSTRLYVCETPFSL